MVDNLGERLVFEVLRNEWLDVADIARKVAIEQRLGGPQLGSGSVDIDHSGCVGVLIVEW